MSEGDCRTMLAAFGDRAAAEAHFEAIAAGRLGADLIDACVADQLSVDRKTWECWLETGSRADISGETTKLDLPVLVIAGDDDKVFGPDVARGVAAGIRRARLETVAGRGTSRAARAARSRRGAGPRVCSRPFNDCVTQGPTVGAAARNQVSIDRWRSLRRALRFVNKGVVPFL